MGLQNAESWKPKEWHIRTKNWGSESKRIATEIAGTANDGQIISECSVDKILKGNSSEGLTKQRINLIKSLSSLSDQALYRMITAFQMSPCSVDSGIFTYEGHPKVKRKRRFQG